MACFCLLPIGWRPRATQSMVGGMKNTAPILCGLSVALFLNLALAGCSAPGPNDDNPVLITVSTDYAEGVPGESITLVWRFSMAENWHLYATNRNDSGFAPTVDLELPAGWTAGGLHWPPAVRYLSEGDILDHVYHEELVLLQKVGVPANAPLGSVVALTGQVEWLACKTSCVPGKDTVSIKIPLAEHHDGPPSAASTAALAKMPVPLPAGLLNPHWEGQKFHFEGTDGAVLSFMPTVDCGKLVNVIRDGHGPHLALRFEAEGETVGPVRGLVTIKEKGGSIRAFVADFPARLLSPDSAGG